MNKKQLLEAIKGYPDEALILVAPGNAKAMRDLESDEPSLCYKEGTTLAHPLSISGNPIDIVLEL